MCGPKGRLPDSCCQDGRAGGTILAGGLCAEGAGLIPEGFLGEADEGSGYTAGDCRISCRGQAFFVRVKVCRNIRY